MHFRLLNSAMMPAFGRYDYAELSPEAFANEVWAAYHSERLISYIGYQQTADLISQLAGMPIAVSREQTELEDGDVLLIARLRYRVADPKTKGEPVPEDFIFGIAYYWTT